MRLLAAALLALLLTGCAADLPMPPMPPLATDQQREQARTCQATYAACQTGCSGLKLGMALGANYIHERTKCVNTGKELLAACYTTMQDAPPGRGAGHRVHHRVEDRG